MNRFPKKTLGCLGMATAMVGLSFPVGAANPQPPTLADYREAGQLICAWKEGNAKEVMQACEKLGFTITNGSVGGNWVVCTWKNGLTEKTLDELQKTAGVRYVEPNFKRLLPPTSSNDAIGPRSGLAAAVTPQDEFFAQLYGMKNIRATEAWRTLQSTPVVVAVIDSGIDYTHEDLKDNIWQNPTPGAKDVHGADFINTKFEFDSATGKNRLIPGNDPMDRQYHGTHVSGTIGAVGNNRIGVTGVNWKVQIMGVRCLAANGFASTDSIANSIRYATDHGAKILNLSLGGRRFSRTELDVIKYAASKNVLLVVAAGNGSEKDAELDNDKVPFYPANYASDNIVVVANIDVKENLNPGSHFGRTTVHIAAPGTAILSTFPMSKTEGILAEEKQFKFSYRTKYDLLTGTSMACPHVAGAIALTMGHPKFAGKTAREAADVVLKNARKLKTVDGKVSTNATLDISFLGKTDDVVVKPPPVGGDEPIKPIDPIKIITKPIDPKDCPKDCPKDPKPPVKPAY